MATGDAKLGGVVVELGFPTAQFNAGVDAAEKKLNDGFLKKASKSIADFSTAIMGTIKNVLGVAQAFGSVAATASIVAGVVGVIANALESAGQSAEQVANALSKIKNPKERADKRQDEINALQGAASMTGIEDPSQVDAYGFPNPKRSVSRVNRLVFSLYHAFGAWGEDFEKEVAAHPFRDSEYFNQKVSSISKGERGKDIVGYDKYGKAIYVPMNTGGGVQSDTTQSGAQYNRQREVQLGGQIADYQFQSLKALRETADAADRRYFGGTQ